jgi:hypothetical protein
MLKRIMVVMVVALGLVMSVSAFAADYDKQATWLKFINNLTAAGVFTKVEKQGIMTHAILSLAFVGLGCENKKLFLNVALAYYVIANPKADFLIFKDPLNGNAVYMF